MTLEEAFQHGVFTHEHHPSKIAQRAEQAAGCGRGRCRGLASRCRARSRPWRQWPPTSCTNSGGCTSSASRSSGWQRPQQQGAGQAPHEGDVYRSPLQIARCRGMPGGGPWQASLHILLEAVQDGAYRCRERDSGGPQVGGQQVPEESRVYFA